MTANDAQNGRVIAHAAVTLAAGVNESELKSRLWGIAQSALGMESGAANQSETLHLVKTELCTFCKEQQLIACSGNHQEDCDLVHIVMAGRQA